jgi:hypothetical protein
MSDLRRVCRELHKQIEAKDAEIERLEALLNDPARLREHIEAQIALEDGDE